MLTRHLAVLALISAVSFTLVPVTTPQASEENERQKVVVEMFDALGYAKMLDKMADQVSMQVGVAITKKHPQIKKEILAKISRIFRTEFLSLKPQIMLFAGQQMTKHFSLPELKALLAFYRTPLGQKMVNIMPKMTQDMLPWMTKNLMGPQQRAIAKVQALLQENGIQM